MEQVFEILKSKLAGQWRGEGIAVFPTITETGYTEISTFTVDEEKPVIHFEQKSWYKNDRPENGRTVFWDTGFFFIRNNEILLVSAQSGGRQETYRLVETSEERFVFNLLSISNDPKTIRSQRILEFRDGKLNYELNMSIHQAEIFQNHLKATLVKN